MTKTQRRRIEKYTRWMANEIGLRDWTFAISRTPAKEGTHAVVYVDAQRWYTTIRLAPDFFEESYGVQRACILHELIHVHLNHVQQAVNHLEPLLGSQTFALHESTHQRGLELAIDALSDNLAKHFPKPKPAKKKES